MTKLLLHGLVPSLRISCAAAFILLFLFSTFFDPLGLLRDLPLRIASTTDSLTTNATLGFQKLYAINLPQRTDRQDALTLMSVLSGLDIEIAPGVLGEDVLNKTIPKDPNSADMNKPGFIGSWRAHLNIMRKIVDEKIATAIIIEDDVDWDVTVRAQMARILREFKIDQQDGRSGTGMTANWDVLWLGNLGERFPNDDQRMIVLEDPTVPSHNDLSPGFDVVRNFPEQSRIIHPSDFPLCSYAYAVSYEGAQKILYHASLGYVVGNFDTDLANNCWLYMNCLSITPPLFHFDRSADLQRDSDTDPGFFKQNREPGQYKNIENSVRQLMKARLGKKRREDRVWRDVSEFGQYFVHAQDLPGQ